MNNILKIAFSTLSTDNSMRTSLLSISLVSESGSRFYAEINNDKVDCTKYSDDLLFSDLKLKSIKSYKDFKSSRYDMYLKDNMVYVNRELLDWLQNESICSNSDIKFYTSNYNDDGSYNYNSVLLIELLLKYSSKQNYPPFIIPEHEEVKLISGVEDNISLRPDFNLNINDIPPIRFSYRIKSLIG